ncbi:MAG: 5'/3'-nucleotidase SurE, partial [Deinococcales bacterium]
MKILVSNDDGIFAPGILALAKAMREIATELIIVAPDVEQSAAGHSITIRRPLRYIPTKLEGLAGVKAFRVDGTPADCVVLGVHNDGRPDLVVSGINIGSNLGFDVTHSGTVAAALEGTTMGIPSIAFSLRVSGERALDFSYGAAYAKDLAREVYKHGLPNKTLLNVNFPEGPLKGIRLAHQSEHTYEDSVLKREDPLGRPYYWITGTPTAEKIPDSDYATIMAGYAAVTP